MMNSNQNTTGNGNFSSGNTNNNESQPSNLSQYSMSSSGGIFHHEALSAASNTATLTIVQAEANQEEEGNANEEVGLPLTLRGQSRVTWYANTILSTSEFMSSMFFHNLFNHAHYRRDENVEDNEGLGRKKSKRCCIFHKEREFGESSTDSSDNESGNDSDSSSSGGGGFSSTKKRSGKKKERRRIARPKQSKVPNYQRYHA